MTETSTNIIKTLSENIKNKFDNVDPFKYIIKRLETSSTIKQDVKEGLLEILNYKPTQQKGGKNKKYIKTSKFYTDKKGIKKTIYKNNTCHYIKLKIDNKFTYKNIKF